MKYVMNHMSSANKVERNNWYVKESFNLERRKLTEKLQIKASRYLQIQQQFTIVNLQIVQMK